MGNSGNIEIEAGSIALQDRAVISVEANGIGNGGQIRLSANQLTVDNSLINAETTQVGQAGTIRLEGDRLSLSQGGQIRSRTSGTGNAGEIQIGSLTRPMPQVQLAGAGSAILADTQAGATGQGGNISLFAGELVIQDQARISAATAGQGNGGSLLLRAEAIALTRGGAIANGVMANATGKGGSIDLATTSLTLTQGGNVQARTLGLGRAGDILVQAETIAISDNLSGIISGSGSPIARQLGLGAGGTIQLFTDRLHISNDGIVSASTFSSGRSGNLEVQAGSIDLNSQGRLSATTQSRGSAGMIWVNARDRVTITGARSGLFANTTESSTGDGGSIFLSTPRLQLQDQARITADSRGSGKGGGIQLITDHLSLTNRSTIFAGTTSTQGGNIDIQARDRLTLRNNSSISASAGTAGAGGNGGNIGIQAGFVIAQLQENSDITANAFAGNGGQVNITADAIFGLQFQPRLTPTSDITASSQLGLSGTVTLNTLRIDPNQGLVALPSSLVDSSQHIAQACSGQQAGNQFVITGRGGLSPDPTEALNQTGLWQDPTVPIVATSPPSAQISPRSWRAEKPPDRPIAEANRWRKAADGTVSLVVDLGSVRGSDPAIAPQTCRMPKQEVQ